MSKWIKQNRALTILLIGILILQLAWHLMEGDDIFYSIGFAIGTVIGICICIYLVIIIKDILKKPIKYKKKHVKNTVDSNDNSECNVRCPICKSDTTLRTVQKGPDVGKEFYVCKDYPKCKGRILVRKADLNGRQVI
jgi:hypothetical protein